MAPLYYPDKKTANQSIFDNDQPGKDIFPPQPAIYNPYFAPGVVVQQPHDQLMGFLYTCVILFFFGFLLFLIMIRMFKDEEEAELLLHDCERVNFRVYFDDRKNTKRWSKIPEIGNRRRSSLICRQSFYLPKKNLICVTKNTETQTVVSLEKCYLHKIRGKWNTAPNFKLSKPKIFRTDANPYQLV